MSHKILVVDDEPRVLETIKAAFVDQPVEVTTTQTGEEALSVLGREPVDLVISDEVMPGMSGTELLAAVRRDYPDTVRMMMTAHPSLSLAVNAINEGHVYYFFTKPFNPVDLIMTVRQALRHKDLVVESRRILSVVRRQHEILKRLEGEHPGITSVETDEEGAIVIDDTDYVSWHELVDEMYREVEKSRPIFEDYEEKE